LKYSIDKLFSGEQLYEIIVIGSCSEFSHLDNDIIINNIFGTRLYDCEIKSKYYNYLLAINMIKEL